MSSFTNLPDCCTCSYTYILPPGHYIHISDDYVSKNLIVLIFSERIDSHPHNIVAVSLWRCLPELYILVAVVRLALSFRCTHNDEKNKCFLSNIVNTRKQESVCSKETVHTPSWSLFQNILCVTFLC